MHFFLFNSSLLMLVAIGLSGFLYLAPGFYLFAAITGLCPGLAVARLLFGKE
jgi:hypothetical protein